MNKYAMLLKSRKCFLESKRIKENHSLVVKRLNTLMHCRFHLQQSLLTPEKKLLSDPLSSAKEPHLIFYATNN